MFRLDVIKVPLAHPEQSAVVTGARIFTDMLPAPTSALRAANAAAAVVDAVDAVDAAELPARTHCRPPPRRPGRETATT